MAAVVFLNTELFNKSPIFSHKVMVQFLFGYQLWKRRAIGYPYLIGEA